MRGASAAVCVASKGGVLSPACSLCSPVAEGCALASTLLSSLLLVRSLLSVLPASRYFHAAIAFIPRSFMRTASFGHHERRLPSPMMRGASLTVCVASKRLSCILCVLFVRWWLALFCAFVATLLPSRAMVRAMLSVLP